MEKRPENPVAPVSEKEHDMTPEALRGERIAEATRRYAADKRSVLEHLMDICETNWTPPEPVNPDLKAAEKYAEAFAPKGTAHWWINRDAYLAGCTRGREGAKELEFALKQIVARIENPHLSPDASVVLEQAYAALAAAKGERV